MSRGLDKKFLDGMRHKLDSGRLKGREDWDRYAWTVPPSSLQQGLLSEVAELFEAVGAYQENSSLRNHIIEECADVANFAMFIADYYRTLDDR